MLRAKEEARDYGNISIPLSQKQNRANNCDSITVNLQIIIAVKYKIGVFGQENIGNFTIVFNECLDK